MNIYKKKRLTTELTQSDMASKLGLSLSRYKAIENGIVKMPKDLIDKFYDIIETNKNSFEILNKREYIEDWYLHIQKEENGKLCNLQEIMNRYNIKSMNQLGILLGYRDGTLLNKYLKNKLETPYKFKNKLYNFLTDERNIQIPNSKPEVTVEKSNTNDLEKWYYSFDFNGFLKINDLTKNEVAREAGVSVSTLTKLQKGEFKYKTNLNSIEKLYNYVMTFIDRTEYIEEQTLEDIEPNIRVCDTLKEDLPEIPSVKQSDNTERKQIKNLIDGYSENLQKIKDDIDYYNQCIKSLETLQVAYCNIIVSLKKVIDDV